MMMMSFGAMATIGVVWVLWGYSEAFGARRSARPRRQPARTTSAWPACSARTPSRDHAGPGVRRLPGHVRDHHGRADQRRHRRPGEVLDLDGLHGGVGHDRLLPDRALGLRLRRQGRRGQRHRARRLDRQQPQGASTSPAAPRSTSTPAPPAWRSCSSSATGTASARSRCARTTSRSSCSAPGCCGSAGSASTPAPRWPPAPPPPWRSSTPSRRPSRGLLGWLVVGTDPRRPRHLARRGLRASSPAWSRITPACALRSPRSARSSSALVAGALCALAVGLKYRFGYDDTLDVVGVHLVGGLVGTLLIGFFASATHRPGSTACSTAAASTSCGARPSARSPCSSSRSSSPTLIGLVAAQDDGLPDRPRRRARGHRPARARRDRLRAARSAGLRSGATPGGRLRPRRARRTQPALRTTVRAPRSGPARPRREEAHRMKLVTAIIKPFKLDDVRRRPGGLRGAGHDGQRGDRLRPPARPQRGLPRRGVHRRHRAQGAPRGARRRRRRHRRGRRRSWPPRGPGESGTARSGPYPSRTSSASAPGSGGRAPSDAAHPTPAERIPDAPQPVPPSTEATAEGSPTAPQNEETP